jgi:hypothetical protein
VGAGENARRASSSSGVVVVVCCFLYFRSASRLKLSPIEVEHARDKDRAGSQEGVLGLHHIYVCVCVRARGRRDQRSRGGGCFDTSRPTSVRTRSREPQLRSFLFQERAAFRWCVPVLDALDARVSLFSFVLRFSCALARRARSPRPFRSPPSPPPPPRPAAPPLPPPPHPPCPSPPPPCPPPPSPPARPPRQPSSQPPPRARAPPARPFLP